jgi:hypothetical protein
MKKVTLVDVFQQRTPNIRQKYTQYSANVYPIFGKSIPNIRQRTPSIRQTYTQYSANLHPIFSNLHPIFFFYFSTEVVLKLKFVYNLVSITIDQVSRQEVEVYKLT